MVDGYAENDIARILDDIVNTASSPEKAVVQMRNRWKERLQIRDYRAAMSAARRAWKLVQESPGQIAPLEAAATARALAHSLIVSGNYDDAEVAHLDEIAILQVADDPVTLADAKTRLARQYIEQGKIEKAEPLLREAESALRSHSGDDTRFDLAGTLEELARASSAKSQFVQAEAYASEALEMMSSAYPFERNRTRSIKQALGFICFYSGKLEQAYQLLSSAISLLRDARNYFLGFYSCQDEAECVTFMAAICFLTEREAECLQNIENALKLDSEEIYQALFSLSQEQLLQARRVFDRRYGFLLAILRRLVQGSASASTRSKACELVCELVFSRKGLTMDALFEARRVLLYYNRASAGPVDELSRSLKTITEDNIRDEAILDRDRAAPDDPRRIDLIARKRKQKEMETTIATNMDYPLGRDDTEGSISDAVYKALRAGVSLVEYATFRDWNFESSEVRQNHWDVWHYLACIVRPGAVPVLEVVFLGARAPIDEMVADFRASLISARPVPEGRPMAGHQYEEVGARLTKMILDPVLDRLRDCKDLLVSPEGTLLTLPFGTLPMSKGGLLNDYFNVRYLGTARDVLKAGRIEADEVTVSAVIAGPDFVLWRERVLDFISRMARGKRFWIREAKSRQKGDASSSGTLKFSPLTGARKEGRAVAKMLGVEPILGREATKRKIKALRSPHYLHIATHGFFLPAAPRPRGSSESKGEVTTNPANPDPLLRTGLAMAGAQAWIEGFELPAEVEDGLLTAAEVCSLDLRGTDLVVLSACDTGLGQIEFGEGVFGLRRAFALAGARTLVISLWRVPDELTSELMVVFYRELKAGKTVVSALAKAQSVIRQRHPHPRYWAAFVCEGGLKDVIVRGKS